MTVSPWLWFWLIYAFIGFLHAARGYVMVSRLYPEIRDRHISVFITMLAITITWPLIFAQAIRNFRNRRRDLDPFDE